jgi:hypothetical protein
MAISAETLETATRRGQKLEDEYAAARAFYDKRIPAPSEPAQDKVAWARHN